MILAIGGIRSVEIGSLMFGRQPNGEDRGAIHELLRLALPRRIYNKSHFDYIADCFKEIVSIKNSLKGLKITYQAQNLRHFTAHLQPIG